MAKGQQAQIIFVVGNKGAGKSTLAQLATSKPSFVQSIFHGLSGGKQKIRATSYQSKDTILVDTPGFDDTIHPDRIVISKIIGWLKERYKDNNFRIGIIFLHQISERRFNDKSNALHTLCAFARSPPVDGKISRIVFATSMWSNMKTDQSKTDAKSREKKLQEKWNEMIEELGVAANSEVMRFETSSSSVEEILRSVTC